MPTNKKQRSAAEHLRIAENHMRSTNPNFEIAYEHFLKAIELQPDDAFLIEVSAEGILALGFHEEALELFLRAIELEPEAPRASRHLYLGQLLEEHESLEHYLKAIELLQEGIDEEYEENNKKMLIQALLAVSELYLTDLCFDEDAEAKCGEAIDTALEIDPENLFALQIKASYKISQCDVDSAEEIMDKVVEILRELPIDEQPDVQFLMQTARILMELEKQEPAVEVLEEVLAMNSDDLEVTELLATIYTIQKKWEDAGEILQIAQTSINSALKMSDLDDQTKEYLQSFNERFQQLIEEIKDGIANENAMDEEEDES
eukprot:TRINITY_DN3266_c1_g3_i1.p1 TRINITY_DN3266_c1_g3~~TRINITY_DN3266_c1_g3_i1.p1  ORF type:complete len:329 (+),score=136.97 TRINITY_DN3266_c1_g3_i1:36-989(+)